MDPNQTQEGTNPANPVDPSQVNQPIDPATGQPAAQPQQAVDPATGQPYPATDTGAMPMTGTTTDMTGTTTDMTGTTGIAVPQPTYFLGIPVDGLVVFTPIFLAGLLLYGWLSGRQPHTEQLSRLAKQQKRIEARESAKPEAIDIFTREQTDFLGKLLGEAGLESQYDKMKSQWMGSIFITPLVLITLCLLQPGGIYLGIFALVLGPGLGAFGFIQYVKWQGNQRQRKLTAQLPQVLESMVSTLKAGSPVVECFKLLSETSPEPIRSEFRRALVSLQLGKPFREVMAEMGTRIRTADFKLLTQAIFISQDVGANLADVVATIAEAIRERFRLRDFLNSLTAQGKMTALFIGCLPYFITAMTYVVTPGYITPFLNHPIARIVFIGMMIWEGIGAYILVKMTTFEV